ncbi:MAG: Gfo/Idh/MocA family oxidoreductase [Firmicutes bacterium]|nr:Gfo/Idh/MocA family oxidoreductase [Bacillota bacterium]
MLRVGVIGTGFGSSVQIPGFLAHPQTEVVAVASGTPGKAAQVAARFGIPRAYDRWQALVEDPQVDAVSIATPPYLHAEIVRASFQAQKHVLCEKPMALDVQEAREMQRMAATSGCVAMIDHEFRFLPARAYARALVQQGELGDPVYAEAVQVTDRWTQTKEWSWHHEATLGGGVLGALGSHLIDALRCFFGEIAASSGWKATRIPTYLDRQSNEARLATAEDTFAISLRFCNGALGTIAVTNTSGAALENRLLLYGRQAVLSIDDGEHLRIRRLHHPAWEPVAIPSAYRALPEGLSDPEDPRLSPFLRLVDRWVQAVAGEGPAIPSFSDGLRVQEIMESVL